MLGFIIPIIIAVAIGTIIGNLISKVFDDKFYWRQEEKMEDFKNINITKHAIVRYFGRVRGVMVTDLNYDGWKNSHHNEVEEAKMELQGLLMTSDYITKLMEYIKKHHTIFIKKHYLLLL